MSHQLDTESLIKKWKELVYDKADEVDPDDVHDWSSLAYGFFLALGASIDEADDLISKLIDLKLI